MNKSRLEWAEHFLLIAVQVIEADRDAIVYGASRLGELEAASEGLLASEEVTQMIRAFLKGADATRPPRHQWLMRVSNRGRKEQR